jgi:hypothetical protein
MKRETDQQLILPWRVAPGAPSRTTLVERARLGWS